MSDWNKKANGIPSKKNAVSLRTWIVLITLNVIAFLVFVAVNLFVVNTVIIQNNELYESTTIKDAVLNDDMSWNTLYVYLKYKFTEPDDIPYVDALDVKIEDPHTLFITVYEKGILGKIYLERKKEYIYFDTDGIVTEISAREIEGVPEIKGLECEKATLYQTLSISTTSLRELLTLTTTLKRNDLIPDTILYGGSNGPILQYSSGVEVVVGTSDCLTQKVERMAAILPMLSKTGTLHLENWTEETTDIIFDIGSIASEDLEKAQAAAAAASSVTKEGSGQSGESQNTDTGGEDTAENAEGTTDMTGAENADGTTDTGGENYSGNGTGEAGYSQDE